MPVFKQWHNVMWNEIAYKMGLGAYLKLRQQYLNDAANKGIVDPDIIRQLEERAAVHAKRAVGFMDNLDMTRDYRMWGNFFTFASKWSTGQARTLGGALGWKPLADLGGGESYGSDHSLINRIEQRQAQKLMFGGMLKMAVAATVMGAVSSYFTGQQSTPWQNFQRDPAHTFDMYLGRDAKGQDHWRHMPLFGFQREITDYALAAVKAQRDGKDWWHVATAPIVRMEGKANPITQTGFEVIIGREISKWDERLRREVRHGCRPNHHQHPKGAGREGAA